jgi:hypothetical protein
MAFSSSTSTWWFIFLLFYFCPPSLLAVEVTQAFLCCTCNCFTTVVFVPSADRYHPSIVPYPCVFVITVLGTASL